MKIISKLATLAIVAWTMPLTSYSALGIGPDQMAQAATYKRRPYVLVDQVPPDSSFSRFRERLRQAVRDRNATFIRAIADPKIQLTFGRPKPLSSLNLDNPKSPFWRYLERAISTGCARYEAPPGQGITESWACPHVFQASLGDPFADVYIVGEGVNVRARPQAGSPVVDSLSNEVVKVDSKAIEAYSQEQRMAMEMLEGWYPVITPAGKRGFVSSRYTFLPAGYRTVFVRQNNSWKMTVFIAGD